MSRMPDDIESKYNHDNKFMWVDSQLEKFMNKVKELEDKVDTLYGIVAQCLTRKEVEKILKESKE